MQIRDEAECPNIVLAILPVIVSMVLYAVLGWNVSICVFLGTLVCIALNVKKFSAADWYKSSVKGLLNGVVPTMNFAFMGAIGTVIASTPMYTSMIDALASSDMNPYLLSAVACNVVAFFIGNVNSTYGVVGSSMSPILILMCNAQGLSVANMQRVFLGSCAVLDAMPTSGGVNSICNMFKVPMRQAYPPVFVVSVLLCGIVTFGVMVPLATILPG